MSGFKNSKPFQDACCMIVMNPRCDETTKEYVTGVADTTGRAGYVSETQAREIGRLYKSIVHRGRYVKYDWWS